ncbi:MAG: sugar transferase [Planctomycetota bacterium]|jgi:lipopolysaccharide/colanic/teichoic acid biosynthesis glycosyltransferase
MKSLKVSIITVCLNSASTIEGTIRSVINQTYPHIEYIINDGGSTDGTVELIKKYDKDIARWVSEKDKGMYDAMNKGIKLATGDIIGILNADDIYADEKVIEDVAKTIPGKQGDTCYGDLVYVAKENIDKVVRYWKSSEFHTQAFNKLWMPPHPTFFVKRDVYAHYGSFDLDFPMAADYELMVRILYKYHVATTYIPRVLVKMRTGGHSNKSIVNIVKANIECYKAWRVNGLNVNPLIFILKPLYKREQYSRLTRALYHLIIEGSRAEQVLSQEMAAGTIIKRLFDIVLSGIGLVCSLPLWIIVALAVKLQDGGPIFYSHERAGKNGRVFKVYKFRSMIPDAEKGVGPVQAKEDDPRVTRIGWLLRATAMDELPQLWNIFIGDMSFVGPRALRPEEIEVGNVNPHNHNIQSINGYKERIRMQPGLTGVAQIYLPSDAPRQKKFRYDLLYFKKQSFWLDLRLILLSFWITFNAKWESRARKL